MDQYWPGPEYEDPDQYWPDDPTSPSLAAFGAAFHAAFDGIVSAFRPFIIVGKSMGKTLEAAGYHAPYVIVDEYMLAANPSKEYREAAAGYKRLKNGRDMPIVLRGSGPQKNWHKNRGKG